MALLVHYVAYLTRLLVPLLQQRRGFSSQILYLFVQPDLLLQLLRSVSFGLLDCPNFFLQDIELSPDDLLLMLN